MRASPSRQVRPIPYLPTPEMGERGEQEEMMRGTGEPSALLSISERGVGIEGGLGEGMKTVLKSVAGFGCFAIFSVVLVGERRRRRGFRGGV